MQIVTGTCIDKSLIVMETGNYEERVEMEWNKMVLAFTCWVWKYQRFSIHLLVLSLYSIPFLSLSDPILRLEKFTNDRYELWPSHFHPTQ